MNAHFYTSANPSGCHPKARSSSARLAVAIALVIGLCAAGCTTYTPPDAAARSGPEALESAAWPSRVSADLDERVRATPREITRLVLDGSKPESEIRPDLLELATKPEATVTYVGVHGQGIIRIIEPGRKVTSGRGAAGEIGLGASSREWTDRTPPPAPTAPNTSDTVGVNVGKEGEAGVGGGSDTNTTQDSASTPPPDRSLTLRFVSYSTLSQRLGDPRFRRWIDWMSKSLKERFQTESSGVKPNDVSTLSMLFEGTRLRLVPPAQGVQPVGTLIHLAGLGSLEWEQPVLDEFTRRGWYILRVATPRVWWYETEPFKIESEEKIPELAEQLATTIDDLIAESAYATEAGLDYLKSQRPDVPQKPLVLLGCSAGALVAPAVAARLAGKLEAVVLVGAGANLLKISQESDLTDGGIRLAWPDGIMRRSWRERLFDEYLKHSKLDPYHAARAMLGTPTLLLLANLDSTVPASSGELLWERLNRPARYTMLAGHRLLFLFLGDQATRIAEWTSKAVRSRNLARGVPKDASDPQPARQ